MTEATFLRVLDVFVFVWGAIWGSFLNVVIYRLPEGMSLVKPPSRCPRCGTQLAWYDNIPILGWLLLRARCRYCKTPIPARYPMVEALTGVLALWAWVHIAHGRLVMSPSGELPLLEVGMTFFFYFYLIAILIAIAFIDLDRTIIPHELTGLGVVLGLIAGFVIPRGGLMGDLWPMVTGIDAIIGLLVGGGVIWALIKGYALLRGIEGMGWGDFTLMGMCGVWVGWQGVVVVLFLASIQGLLATVGALAYAKLTGQEGDFLIQDVDAIDPWEGKGDGAPDGGADASGAAEARDDEEASGAAPEEAAPTGGETDEDDDEVGFGQLAIPFGPFIVLGTLEYILLGHFFVPLLLPPL